MAVSPGVPGSAIGASVLAAIGATPLVELSRVTTGLDGRVLAKLEYLNPGGSKKDRIALRMIEDAEASGQLRPGQTVVELTSGNTGTGLAIVCAVMGYPFVAVMSSGNSTERAQMMRALGAEVILVGQQHGSLVEHVSGDDLALVEQVASRVAVERGAFRADQFHLTGNPSAHHDGTATELWAQCGGEVDVFCEFVGTGGTFAGVARFLKSYAESDAYQKLAAWDPDRSNEDEDEYDDEDSDDDSVECIICLEHVASDEITSVQDGPVCLACFERDTVACGGCSTRTLSRNIARESMRCRTCVPAVQVPAPVPAVAS